MLFKGKSLDIIFLLLSIVLTGYTWRLLPEIVIRSDGFVHMLAAEQQRFWGQRHWITGLELDASILGAILPKFFGANIRGYLWFELVFILLLVLLFYVLVRVITKSSSIAFVSTLIAGTSYFGNWNMYGTHCYCFFLERVTNIPFVLASFLFLHLFLTTGKKKIFAFSLVLYLVGLKLGHLALLLTPPFVLYPIWWCTVRSWKKETWKGILIGAAYFITSTSIVLLQRSTYGDWGPGRTLTEFVLNPAKYDYFRAIALQLAHWSQYSSILPNLFSESPLRDIDARHAAASIPFVLLVYIIAFVTLYKFLPKFRALLLTCITSVPAIFFLNAYVRLDSVIVPDSNRYLYYPNFFLGIFWGIFTWYVFLRHKDVRRLLGIGILIAYYIINVTVIDYIFRRTFQWNESTKALFSHVIKTRDMLKPGTLVVATYPEFWVQEAHFFTEQLGNGTVTYDTESMAYRDWKTKIPDYEHVLTIAYDAACNCVKETKVK